MTLFESNKLSFFAQYLSSGEAQNCGAKEVTPDKIAFSGTVLVLSCFVESGQTEMNFVVERHHK